MAEEGGLEDTKRNDGWYHLAQNVEKLIKAPKNHFSVVFSDLKKNFIYVIYG